MGVTNGWYRVRFPSSAEGWVAGWLAGTDENIARQAGLLAPGGAPTHIGNAMAQYALQFQGTPYRFGGSTPAAFDCSGFVKYVCDHHGIKIPRTSFDQWKVGTPVDVNHLIAGDLVFFANTYTSGVSHVGMYVGDRKFVHASQTGVGVIVQPLSKRARSYCGARRVY